MTPIPGSPFATGGVGTGATIASQGALQISDDGRYMLAADTGSNEISVLRIGHDGAVRQIHGGTVLSGGLEPVSIAVHGRLVYVANGGDGGSNYTGFTAEPRRSSASTGSLDRAPAGTAPSLATCSSTPPEGTCSACGSTRR